MSLVKANTKDAEQVEKTVFKTKMIAFNSRIGIAFLLGNPRMIIC